MTTSITVREARARRVLELIDDQGATLDELVEQVPWERIVVWVALVDLAAAGKAELWNGHYRLRAPGQAAA